MLLIWSDKSEIEIDHKFPYIAKNMAEKCTALRIIVEKTTPKITFSFATNASNTAILR